MSPATTTTTSDTTATASPAIGFENHRQLEAPISLQVSGSLPDWLHGTLYRIGPGVHHVQTKSNKTLSFHHWFDGLTVVHRFYIHPKQDGEERRVEYFNRETAQDLEKYIAEEEKLPMIMFAQDPCRSIFKKAMTVSRLFTFPFSDAYKNGKKSKSFQNIGVTMTKEMMGPGTLCAKTDANMLQQLDPVTLDPLDCFTYSKFDVRLKGALSAAHAEVDASTGEFFNFTMEPGPYPVFHFFKMSLSQETPKVTLLADIHAPATYIHSFSLTANYVIFILWPCRIGWGGAKMLLEGSVMNAMSSWNPDHPTLFYVIARDGSGVKRVFSSKGFYCFHTVNAWEQNEDIFLDLVWYKDNEVIFSAAVDNLRGKMEKPKKELRDGQWTLFRLPGALKPSKGEECKIDLQKQASKVDWHKFFKEVELVKQFSRDWAIELPTMNRRSMFKKHRYVYGVAFEGETTFINALAKLDTEAEGDTGHLKWHLTGHYPSEPIFVPRPDGLDEDDGVVVSVVLDASRSASFLLVLDAKTMMEIARADMRKPQSDESVVVPFGFHGLWSA